MSTHTANSATGSGLKPAWYLVRCKPRQDERAEEHLLRQGYGCCRPTRRRDQLPRGRRQTITEGCFVALDAIFVAMDGDERVNLLLNLLNRQHQICLPLTSIAKH